MAARPLVSVYDAESGKAEGEGLPLPAVFTAPIRRDIVHFVHYNIAKNSRQAYAVSKYAGHQVSARSWGTGRAVARIPRVRGSGTHRTGQGAFGNMCRGGRMFAPTRTWRKWHRKVSVNQRRYATVSALAASAITPLVMARGHKVDNLEEVPLVIDGLNNVSKTRDAIAVLEKVGAMDDANKARASKHLRRGKGKARNRRYVMRRGPLVVHSGERNVEQAFRNLPGVEVCDVSRLNLLQLAPGGHMGRFCVWTKDAFDQLDFLYGSADQAAERKSGYKLPRAAMQTADLARIINSEEVQAVVRPAKESKTRVPLKRNPIRNRGARAKLNPYSIMQRRKAILEQEGTAERRRAARAARRTKDAEDREQSSAFGRRLTEDEWQQQ